MIIRKLIHAFKIMKKWPYNQLMKKTNFIQEWRIQKQRYTIVWPQQLFNCSPFFLRLRKVSTCTNPSSLKNTGIFLCQIIKRSYNNRLLSLKIKLPSAFIFDNFKWQAERNINNFIIWCYTCVNCVCQRPGLYNKWVVW